MKKIFLFEWMDLKYLPKSLREVLMEILEYSLDILREYYSKCADSIAEELLKNKYDKVFEVGAGSAILLKKILEKTTNNVTLIPCDINPRIEHFKKLEERYSGKIKPIYYPLNVKNFDENISESIIVFSASFHHVPIDQQIIILKSLKSKAKKVFIFEPLTRRSLSVISNFSLIFPILAFPICKPKFSHFLWCWILPVAVPMFIWDGIVSSLRQNNHKDWEYVFRESGIIDYNVEIMQMFQQISISL